MKDFPLKNIIEEWLAKNGNPKIGKQVELEAKLIEEEFRHQKTKTVEEELLEQYKYYIQNKHESNTKH